MGLEKSQTQIKNINLLPAELQYGFFKRLIVYNEAHPRKFLLYGLIGIFAFAVVVTLTQSVRASRYQDKNQVLEQDIRRLQAKHKEAEGVMNQVAQAKQMLSFQLSLLNKRKEFLKQQYNFGHHWAIILAELKGLVPKGVWLIGVKTEDYYLKISGGALDEDLVTDFMSQLRKSPVFNNVSFNYTQNSSVGKTKVVLFELTCNYEAGFMRPPQRL